MKHNLVYRMATVSSIISRCLPDGKFKEWLRSKYYKKNNSLYALNEIIKQTELIDDISLLVQLNDGTRLYGPKMMSSYPLKYGDSRKLERIKQFEHFGTFINQLYERYVEETYEEHYKLKKGDIVIDVGANIGTFSVKAAKAIGDEGKVIAIEPETSNQVFLRRNIEANSLKNVIIVPKGVWSSTNETKFYLSDLPCGHCANSFYQDGFYGTNSNSRFEIVQVDTLDNILKELEIKRVDFIKMDIEGAEVEALKGMEETLKNHDVKLAGEHHIIKGKPTYPTIANQLRKKEFEVHKEGSLFYARKK